MSTAAAEAKKMISLTSSDGETFQMEEAVAKKSQTIKHMIEDGCADGAIPLHNVTDRILAKVIEYCNKHGDGGDRAGFDEHRRDLEAWDAAFVKVDQPTLFDLILAVNYLDIEGLMDLTCGTVAGMIAGKSVEEIREIFHIENDFTPEEEAEQGESVAFDD